MQIKCNYANDDIQIQCEQGLDTSVTKQTKWRKHLPYTQIMDWWLSMVAQQNDKLDPKCFKFTDSKRFEVRQINYKRRRTEWTKASVFRQSQAYSATITLLSHKHSPFITQFP